MKKLVQAFTLIELLIVIVIIGILATSLIPRLKGLQNKAKFTRVEKDFQDFKQVVYLAQSSTNKVLSDITRNTCSACACDGGYPFTGASHLATLPSNHQCRSARITSLRRIEEAAGLGVGELHYLETDPWGSPYLLNENEVNDGGGGCNYNYGGVVSTPDTLATAGPDGYAKGINMHNVALTTLDNRSTNIPHIRCSKSAY